MPRKPAHEQFDTLKAIQERAFELFGRYGYEGVSIGDIAKAARLSKGALYWHFHSKEELYLECLKRLHGIFDEYIFEPMRAEKDAVQGILGMFTGVARMLDDSRVVHGVGGYWLIPPGAEAAPILAVQRTFESASIATVAEVLRRATASGRIDMGADTEAMARGIISVVEAVILPLRNQPPEQVRETLRVLARTLLRAYTRDDAVIALARLI